MVVRAQLMVSNLDYGTQKAWKFYVLDYRNVLQKSGVYGAGKDRFIAGSYWLVNLGYRQLGQGIETRYELPLSMTDAVRGEYLPATLPKLLEVFKLIKRVGEQVGVKTVVITSSYRTKDFYRDLVREIGASIITGKVFDEEVIEVPSGTFAGMNVYEDINENYYITYGRQYLVLVKDGDKYYYVGNPSLYYKALSLVV